MRRLKEDRVTGYLHLGIDTIDDLWTLRNLIQPGDLVTASTMRTAETADDKIRSEKAEKKRMTLGLRVESVDWHDFDDHLRVHGLIEVGPQDLGRHHTIILRDEPGTDVKIQKKGPLQAWHRDLVKQAIEQSKRPQVILLAIDDTEAQFGQLQSYGLRLLGSLPATGQGKGYDGKGSQAAKKRFYDEVIDSLRTMRADDSIPLLVVGPGWWREEFLDHGRTRAPDVVAGARTDGVSQGGKGGLQEAMKRGMLSQVAQAHRVDHETELVEDVLQRIAKAEPVAYGPAEVRHAVEVGAVERLLVTDQRVRKGDDDDLLRDAEHAGAAVHIVSTGHEAGAQLQRMGGLAALLRFAIGA